MERRDFIKGMLGGAALLLATRIEASGYEDKKDEKDILHRLKDPQHPTKMEKKHVPAIVAPEEVVAGEWFEVKVKVGYQITHPSTPKHWITEIKLLCDGKEVADLEYPVGGVAAPEATFKIRLERDGVLEAIEHCNLHGTWISQPVKISVKKA